MNGTPNGTSDRPLQCMIIAGETSGDRLAAELVRAAREVWSETRTPAARGAGPVFFGAGGPALADAGVELACDLTAHAVIGLWEAIRSYPRFKKIFDSLLGLALQRRPDILVLVDFSGFNRRFARAVRRATRTESGLSARAPWRPKIVQYVSPQVWASRPRRAHQLARDIDLLLCTFPFEKDWYSRRVPQLRVEFVGNPIVERHERSDTAAAGPATSGTGCGAANGPAAPRVVLLPGSRVGELKRHLPVMLGAARLIAQSRPVRFSMVLPTESLAAQARAARSGTHPEIEILTGPVTEALCQSDLAIASTGTVTLECAVLGVPTLAIYKTSWLTYQIGKRLVTVPHFAMPNILAGRLLFPELIQDAATAEGIAAAALGLLNNPDRAAVLKRQLAEVVRSLGPPGASTRAARAILAALE